MEHRHDDGPRQETPEAQPGTTARVRQSLAETVDEFNQKVQDVSERAARVSRRSAAKVDAQREPAARRLEETAERVREGSARLITTTTHAAEVTGDKLQATADYIREHDVRAMIRDVKEVLRRHPGPTLATAAVIGFLVGRALSNRD